MHHLLLFILALAASMASAQQSAWYVLSREDGCMDPKVLVKVEKLSRAPVSPEDFAAMMRERGEAATIGPAPGFPPELTGKVMQVNVGRSKAPIFVKEEICRNIGK